MLQSSYKRPVADRFLVRLTVTHILGLNAPLVGFSLCGMEDSSWYSESLSSVSNGYFSTTVGGASGLRSHSKWSLRTDLNRIRKRDFETVLAYIPACQTRGVFRPRTECSNGRSRYSKIVSNEGRSKLYYSKVPDSCILYSTTSRSLLITCIDWCVWF